MYVCVYIYVPNPIASIIATVSDRVGMAHSSVQFSRSIVSDSMDCSTLGLPVHHQLLEFTQTHIH